MRSIIVAVVAGFTLMNVLVSAYMSYNTVKLAVDKCRCAVKNAYWFIIVIYFLSSGIFLLYALLVISGLLKGAWFVHLLVVYLVATFVYVGGSFTYTNYLKGQECRCVGTHYTKVLHIITVFRMLMAIITAIALATWGAYVFLRKSFVSRK